mmetsp:Transcript_8245/g.32535  ORF Transcript_8245/g.32535 Transcript_8245/m.32535 type:complete len:217 (+) Transcript_8245:406-1056(+)
MEILWEILRESHPLTTPPPSRTRRAFWRVCRWRPRRWSTAGSPAAIPPRRAGSSTSSSPPPSPDSLSVPAATIRGWARMIRRAREKTTRARARESPRGCGWRRRGRWPWRRRTPPTRSPRRWPRRTLRAIGTDGQRSGGAGRSSDPTPSRPTTLNRDPSSVGTWRGRPAHASRRSPPRETVPLKEERPFSTRAPRRFGSRRRRVRLEILPESVRHT